LWLERRLNNAKQRCEKPNNSEYKNYGGRGIKFNFKSGAEAAKWMVKEFGIPYRNLELDRIDTNGNYEPGNLRFVSRETNQANRRVTLVSRWDQKYWPYAETAVRKYLKEGYTRDEIIGFARDAVHEHRSGWKGIQARLESMIYEMPEDIIVTPYLENSSTTVDTEEA
jgi:hypothetical protein